jgi:hypothetical protein
VVTWRACSPRDVIKLLRVAVFVCFPATSLQEPCLSIYDLNFTQACGTASKFTAFITLFANPKLSMQLIAATHASDMIFKFVVDSDLTMIQTEAMEAGLRDRHGVRGPASVTAAELVQLSAAQQAAYGLEPVSGNAHNR